MKLTHLLSLLGASTSLGLNVRKTVQTSSGPVKGHIASEEAKVLAYLGIPYAVPPVGSLRFMPPVKYRGNSTINGGRIVSYIPLT